MYNLTQMMFETVYFINMLVDKKNEIHKPKLNFYVTIKLPRITTNPVSLFDAVILLCALVCKKNHFAGNIINSGTKILTVMGFDFEENFKLIIDNIKKNDKVYDQQTLKYFEKMNVHSKDDINKLYTNMVNLAEFCVEKMNSTDDYKVYQAYKGLYDAMMVKNYTTKVLSKSNGEVASTYLDYLDDQNPFLADFVNACSVEQTGIYIDHILGTINEIIPDLEYLSTINGTDNIIVTAMVKLIEFFKSYTVDLRNINILYVLDSRRYNMIRMVSDVALNVSIDYRQRLEYYLDTIARIGVKNFFNDYVIPIEMIYLYNKLSIQDNLDLTLRDDFLMDVKMCYEDMMRVIYADFLSVSSEMRYQFVVILEHMQKFITKITAEECIDMNTDLSIKSNINVDQGLEIRYSDLNQYVKGKIESYEKIPMYDTINYDYNIVFEEIINDLERDILYKGCIYNNEEITIKKDAVTLYLKHTMNKETISFNDIYDIIINFVYNENIIHEENVDMYESIDISESIIDNYYDSGNISNKIDKDEIIKFYENIRIYYE